MYTAILKKVILSKFGANLKTIRLNGQIRVVAVCKSQKGYKKTLTKKSENVLVLYHCDDVSEQK